jgi:hypothetical protein
MTMYTRTDHLGFFPALVAPAAGIPGVNIVLGVAAGAVTLFSLFKNWFQRGELKRQATAKAEDFVRAFYALADGRWPIPEELPIVPGGTTFSRESVAGLIENCSLVAASSYLDTLERQLVELAKSTLTDWARQWGYNDISYLRRRIAYAETVCEFDTSGDILPPEQQEPPTPGGTQPEPLPGTLPGTLPPVNQAGMTGTSQIALLLVGAALLAGLAIKKRRR